MFLQIKPKNCTGHIVRNDPKYPPGLGVGFDVIDESVGTVDDGFGIDVSVGIVSADCTRGASVVVDTVLVPGVTDVCIG